MMKLCRVTEMCEGFWEKGIRKVLSTVNVFSV